MNIEKIQSLAEKIVSVFGAENVVGILLHGSVLFNPQLSQDVDLVVIMRFRNVSDCESIRRLIVQSRLSQLPIQLHLFYLDEIPSHADFCSINTCGAFIAWHIRQAKVLFGENIYDRMSGPSDYHLQMSLLQKFQQYAFQLRNMICKTKPISNGELLQARKRSVVVLKDLLMSDGTLIQQEVEIVREALARFPGFSPEEAGFLHRIVTKWEKPASQVKVKQFLQNCLAVHERAYDMMRMRMVKSTKCKFLS